MKNIIKAIAKIIQGLTNIITGVFYTFFNYLTSVFIIASGVYCSLYFLGIDFGYIETVSLITLMFIIEYTGILSILPFFPLTGKRLWQYIMEHPEEMNMAHLSEHSEECKIVSELCNEQGMKMPYMLIQLDGEGRGDIPLDGVNAFAWFNSITTQGFNNLDSEAKRFILGHELGHIYKKHNISAHFDEVLMKIYNFFKDCLSKIFSFDLSLKSIVIKFIVGSIIYNYYQSIEGSPNMVNQMIEDSKYLWNLIPAYISLDVSRMLMKWANRQQEYSCDSFALTANSDDEKINEALKGGEKTFNIFYDGKKATWFKLWFSVIYDNHPHPKSRIRSLFYRYKSYFLHTGMTLIRYMLIFTVFAFVNIGLNEYNISILNHKKVQELAKHIHSNVLMNFNIVKDEGFDGVKKSIDSKTSQIKDNNFINQFLDKPTKKKQKRKKKR